LLADVDRVLGDPFQAARDEDHQHRPFARVEIVSDVHRADEDLAVESVDFPVAVGELSGDVYVAHRERLFGL
jgi:hypothetical protein